MLAAHELRLRMVQARGVYRISPVHNTHVQLAITSEETKKEPSKCAPLPQSQSSTPCRAQAQAQTQTRAYHVPVVNERTALVHQVPDHVEMAVCAGLVQRSVTMLDIKNSNNTCHVVCTQSSR